MRTMTARILAAGLAVSALVLPAGLSAKERRGAMVVVTRLDGSQASGELIAVKPESLLLLTDQAADVSVGLADIREVRVIRRSRALLFAGIGGAAGAAAGATVGAYVFNKGSDDEPSSFRNGLVFGALGALAGLLTSSVFSGDSRFVVADGRPQAVAEFWDRLRSYSREGRLPGAPIRPGVLQAGRLSLRTWPRFRLSLAGSLVRPTEHLGLPGGAFRFPEEAPPEAGPYPFVMVDSWVFRDAWAGTPGPIGLAYDWNDRWSAEIEASFSPATSGGYGGSMRFTSSIDGKEYDRGLTESHKVGFTSLQAGLTYRLLPPTAFRRHSIEAGAAVGPAFVRCRVYAGYSVRKTVLSGRAQAAYDYYFVPAVSAGVFAGYRIMKATLPGAVLSFPLFDFPESGGTTLQRPTEITLPDLLVDGSGPFVGLRIGFRI